MNKTIFGAIALVAIIVSMIGTTTMYNIKVYAQEQTDNSGSGGTTDNSGSGTTSSSTDNSQNQQPSTPNTPANVQPATQGGSDIGPLGHAIATAGAQGLCHIATHSNPLLVPLSPACSAIALQAQVVKHHHH